MRKVYWNFLFAWGFIILKDVGAKPGDGIENVKKLHQTLFANYSILVKPFLDYSRPAHVQVSLRVTHVLGLDIKKQVLKLKGYFQFRWKDDLLQWNPTEYGAIEHFHVPQKMIWLPDLVFSNDAEGLAFLGSEETAVTVSSTGRIMWDPGFRADLSCKVDISKYPFDENVCPVTIQPWTLDNKTVKFVPIEIGEVLNLGQMNPSGEFVVSSAGYKINFMRYEELFYEEIHIYLKISRRPAYIALSLLMPIIMLAVLCVLSFLLSPEDPEKVTVSITVLLSFTVFLGIIDNDLPETSDNMSYLVVYISLLQALGFLSVVGNTVVLALSRMDNKADHPWQIASYSTSPVSEKTTTTVLENISQSKERFRRNSSGGRPPFSSVEQAESGVDTNLQPKRENRAYRLNKIFFTVSSTALVVVTSVLGFLLSQ